MNCMQSRQQLLQRQWSLSERGPLQLAPLYCQRSRVSLNMSGPAVSASSFIRPSRTCSPHLLYPKPAVRCSAFESDSSGGGGSSGSVTACSSSSTSSGSDPFVAAVLRLQALLSTVGDGEEELMRGVVADEESSFKIQTNTALGGVITLVAIIICTLCSADPWGGASFSWHSLSAAAVGALVVLPVVGLRAWSWTSGAKQVFPSLSGVHSAQLELVKPWISRMTKTQVAILMGMEVLPVTMLLLPAAQSGLTLSMDKYGQVLQNSLHLDLPSYSLQAAALLLTALIAGYGRFYELSADAEEYSVVETASVNADRYYRMMLPNSDGAHSDGNRAAVAFRAVAQAWAETRLEASLTAATMTITDVLFLGALWYWTGDLTAPATAAMLINWVDYHSLHDLILQQEERVAQRTNSNSR